MLSSICHKSCYRVTKGKGKLYTWRQPRPSRWHLVLLKHQTARARPGTAAAGSQRAQLPACWLSAPHTAAQLSTVKEQITRDLARNPITRAQSHCYEIPLPSRWEVISVQMANIPQVEQGKRKNKKKKKTRTKRSKRQAHSKLHTQKRSHGSLSCVSHSLSRLPFHLRQEPQLLVTNLLLHQQHQVTVQLSVQRRSIIFFISICHKNDTRWKQSLPATLV